jgi:carboxylesterase type B
MSHILSTPFGAFRGKKGDGITQYRGIKYATVTGQLSAPELVTDYGTNIFDATHYGYVIFIFNTTFLTPTSPRAPAIDGCAFEQNTLIQCAIGAAEETPRMSGTECLNLNITVPDTEKKGLPVMVFVHGGGYVMGGNHWPQYDPSRLVKMSEELDMPVIVVNIK